MTDLAEVIDVLRGHARSSTCTLEPRDCAAMVAKLERVRAELRAGRARASGLRARLAAVRVWLPFMSTLTAMSDAASRIARITDLRVKKWRKTEARKKLLAERMALFAQRERMLFHRGDEP